MPKLEELANATEETLVDVLGFPEQDGCWALGCSGLGVGQVGHKGGGWLVVADVFREGGCLLWIGRVCWLVADRSGF